MDDTIALREEILVLKGLLAICAKRLDEYERTGEFSNTRGHAELLEIIMEELEEE